MKDVGKTFLFPQFNILKNITVWPPTMGERGVGVSVCHWRKKNRVQWKELLQFKFHFPACRLESEMGLSGHHSCLSCVFFFW